MERARLTGRNFGVIAQLFEREQYVVMRPVIGNAKVGTRFAYLGIDCRNDYRHQSQP